jgi:hypothetical protein
LPQVEGSIEARLEIARAGDAPNRTAMRFELVGRRAQRRLKKLMRSADKSKTGILTVV